MTDLCYNCGDCHLPNPCALGLKRCDICESFGHTYNFCPLSVRHKDPGYQYWALCHNCDKWHLPDPCPNPLHNCTQCGHRGHTEVFCPQRPVSRYKIPVLPNDQTGVKPQRTDGSDVSEGHVAADIAQKIKMETATQFASLLRKGHDSDQVLRIFASGIDPALSNAVASQTGSVTNTPTSAPARPYSTTTEAAPGLYTIQYDRFNRGDFVQTQAQIPARQYATPHGSFRATRGNVNGSEDNINVGAAGLQHLAQGAINGHATTADPNGPFISPTSGDIIGPSSSTPNIGAQLATAIASTVSDYNQNLQAPAPAHQLSDNGFPAVNPAMMENMHPYQTRVSATQMAEDSIAVGGGAQIEDEPSVAPKKNGEPKKRQPPKRVQPTRKSTLPVPLQ